MQSRSCHACFFTHQWKPLLEHGVETDGLYVKVLRFDEAQQRPPTFLLKFEAGASYPNHNHPGGEEAYVLEGEVRFGATQLQAGDYLYTPPMLRIRYTRRPDA